MNWMKKLFNSVSGRNGRTAMQWLWFVGCCIVFLVADQALSKRWPDSYALVHPLAAVAVLYLAVAAVGVIWWPRPADNA
jgi:uncharacterized membrane protein YhaH (DUF805 family)